MAHQTRAREVNREPKLSLRAAINAHCKWCIYDPASGLGNWRQQVSACEITRCALWPVRPRSKPEKVAEQT